MSRAYRGRMMTAWVALLSHLTLASCSYVAYQEQMQTEALPAATWQAEHAVTFDYIIEQPRLPHTLYLYVRYNNHYEYTTLPLTVELRSSLGWSATASLTLSLAEQPGVWSGKGYALRQQLYRVSPTQLPPHPGIYTIQLRQKTAETPLVGIETIGVAWVAE